MGQEAQQPGGEGCPSARMGPCRPSDEDNEKEVKLDRVDWHRRYEHIDRLQQDHKHKDNV